MTLKVSCRINIEMLKFVVDASVKRADVFVCEDSMPTVDARALEVWSLEFSHV